MWGSGCCVWWRAGRSATSQGHGCRKQRGSEVVFNCHRMECTDPCRVGLCSSANILKTTMADFCLIYAGNLYICLLLTIYFPPRYCIYSSVQASGAAAGGGCLNSQYKDTWPFSSTTEAECQPRRANTAECPNVTSTAPPFVALHVDV